LTFQAGLVIFGLASVGAALSESTTQLIIARAAQGIGGAIIMPSTLSIIVDVFPRKDRAKAIGNFDLPEFVENLFRTMTFSWHFCLPSIHPVSDLSTGHV
jgi:MFS family permease